MGNVRMIELHIHEPGEGRLSTVIDRARLDETIADNLPHVAPGTTFEVNGEVVWPTSPFTI